MKPVVIIEPNDPIPTAESADADKSPLNHAPSGGTEGAGRDSGEGFGAYAVSLTYESARKCAAHVAARIAERVTRATDVLTMSAADFERVLAAVRVRQAIDAGIATLESAEASLSMAEPKPARDDQPGGAKRASLINPLQSLDTIATGLETAERVLGALRGVTTTTAHDAAPSSRAIEAIVHGALLERSLNPSSPGLRAAGSNGDIPFLSASLRKLDATALRVGDAIEARSSSGDREEQQLSELREFVAEAHALADSLETGSGSLTFVELEQAYAAAVDLDAQRVEEANSSGTKTVILVHELEHCGASTHNNDGLVTQLLGRAPVSVSASATVSFTILDATLRIHDAGVVTRRVSRSLVPFRFSEDDGHNDSWFGMTLFALLAIVFMTAVHFGGL